MLFNFLKKEKLVITNCVFNCGQEKCPKWLVLERMVTNEKNEPKKISVGKCSDVWSVLIQLEHNQHLEKIIRERNPEKSKIIVPQG